ncbi:MAG: hypothetical protein QRY71_00070 [Candidatus Rhabdochlamydia sp.]
MSSKLSQKLTAAFGLLLLHHSLLSHDASFVKEEYYPTLVSLTSKASSPLGQLDHREDTYTINFNSISAAAYVRFVSKITHLNFIFNEDELNFNVTIVSEEPLSPRNITSTLIQILRVHNLVVLEQEGNLLITSVRNVSQLATVINEDTPPNHCASPLATKIFPVKNASVNTIASVIKPMLSDTALLEISPETRQIIVTDIVTNLDKIASLLSSIDTPYTPYEVSSYQIHYGDIDEIIKTATQILSPLAEGTTLLFIPREDTGTIFIVSAPHLIEKSLLLLKNLDSKASQEESRLQHHLSIFLYTLQHKKGNDFLISLKDLEAQIEKQGGSRKLTDSLATAKWIKDSNSILFLGDEDTLDKLKKMMPLIDTRGAPTDTVSLQTHAFIYKIKFADPLQLKNSFHQVMMDLKKSHLPDEKLIEAISSLQLIKESNSLMFTGTDGSLAKIAEFLKIFDSLDTSDGAQQIFIYHPNYHNGEELYQAFNELMGHLSTSGYSDPLMAEAVKTMQWMPLANAMVFSGAPSTLGRLEAIVTSLDHAKASFSEQEATTFFIYKLKEAEGSSILNNLKKVAKNLESSGQAHLKLIQTLEEATWIPENNSILLKGKASSIEQAKVLISEFDFPCSDPAALRKNTFFIYKPLFLTPPVFLMTLKDIGTTLRSSEFIESSLLIAIDKAQYIESTQTVVFTGHEDTLQKIKEVIAQIDVPVPTNNVVQNLGQDTFLIYKIQNAPALELIAALKDLGSQLGQEGVLAPEELEVITDLKYIKATNSLLFTGDPEVLKKVESMVKDLDSSILIEAPETDRQNHFVVYTPLHHSGSDLIQMLDEFQTSLISTGIVNKELFDTISHLKWIPRTRSLIISGSLTSIKSVEELLGRFDVPSLPEESSGVIETIDNSSFLIYKLQYHQGSEILTALKQIGLDLAQNSSVGGQNLLSAINSLQWIKVTNSLLASGQDNSLNKLQELMHSLDVPLRQVFIEVLVIETDLTNTQNFGLQWGGNLQYLNKFSVASGNFPLSSPNSFTKGPSSGIIPSLQTALQAMPPSPTNIPFVNGFDLGVIGDLIFHKGKSFLSLGSLVNALQTDTDSTVVLNPQIITQDNQTSSIFVGSNIPFIGSLVTTDSNILSSSSNIEYRDIGFNLTVTPTIGSNDIVTLDISNDISEVISQPSIGQVNATGSSTSQITGITTSHTTMNTKVHVPDKHFVVLSGMVRDSKARFKSGIPCLGGLPMIGAFFSENDRIMSKHNVIIFMRPHIVNTYEEYKLITQNQENKYKEAASQTFLKEDFDSGIDMIKDIDNEP